MTASLVRVGTAAAAAIIGLAATAPASATATYSAGASAVLTVLDTTDLFVDASAFVFDVDFFASGNAAAGAQALVFPDTDGGETGDFVSLFAAADGTADPTPAPGSLASSFALTDGVLVVENQGTGPVEVQFALEFTVSAFADVNDSLEDAFAEATVDLSGDAQGFWIANADTLIGDPGEEISNTFNFSIELDQGEFAELFLLADASGEAFSQVPVAGALPLMALGLLGLGLINRRRAA